MVRIRSGNFLIQRSHPYSGAVLVDITTHLGPDSYSGVIFLGSAPFRSWNTEIMNPWLTGTLPRILSTDLSDLCSTARELVGAFPFDSDNIYPATKLAWLGAYANQHPVARMNYITRTQDEDALKDAAGKVRVLALLGEEDKFLLPDRVEKLYKETFAEVEVQIWPEVGHLPFFEEPEKTKNAILGFVHRVTKVRFAPLQASLACLSFRRPEDYFRSCKTLNLMPNETS